EPEIRKQAVRVELLRQGGDAVLELLALAEEVVQVLGRIDPEAAAHGRGARVEVDEDRAGLEREAQGEVDRDGALADSAFAGGDGKDGPSGAWLRHVRWGGVSK